MHGYKFFNRYRARVLRKQGLKCGVKETAEEWGLLNEEQRKKYHIEANKVNKLIANTHNTKNDVEVMNSEMSDSDDDLDSISESELDAAVNRTSNHATKAEDIDLDRLNLFDQKELKITRKCFNVSILKQRISTY